MYINEINTVTTTITTTITTRNEMQEEEKLEIVMLNCMSQPTRAVEYWLPDLELHVSTNMNCPLEKWLSDKHINFKAANMHLKMQYTQQNGLQDPLVVGVEL